MIFSHLLNMQSHPSWVCGLKLHRWVARTAKRQSHPSWVCGLKLPEVYLLKSAYFVTPFVGVWIETLYLRWILSVCNVTPFVGVWIETRVFVKTYSISLVTPFVGVWIETNWRIACLIIWQSHPSWVCGLKQICPQVLHLL